MVHNLEVNLLSYAALFALVTAIVFLTTIYASYMQQYMNISALNLICLVDLYLSCASPDRS